MDAATAPSPPQSFKDVVGLWPSYEAMAEALGVPVATVRKWAFRDRIPEGWWHSILAAAPARAAGLTADVLVRLAAKMPAEVEAE